MLWLLFNTGGPAEIDFNSADRNSLVSMIEEGKVKAIYVSGGYTAYILTTSSKYGVDEFYKKPSGRADYYAQLPYRYSLENTEIKIDIKDEAGTVVDTIDGSLSSFVTVRYNNPESSSTITSIIMPIGLVIVLGIVIFFIFRQSAGANKQAMNFGKLKARVNMNVKVRFDDVAGAEEEKEELQEIVEFLKSPAKFTGLGARVPKGVLLVGPPGTGKTLFAKAVAGESNVPFFSISGSDFVEMFVGTGAARVRDLFDQAKRNMPCIVFIDEIDAVGRQRGAGLGGGHDEREQTLNQLLVQMDGFEKNDGIIIMAATNRADILDPALLRPGRFDRQIYVNLPDVKGREAIFKVHSRNKPLAPDVSFKVLARMTSGFSGADIENLLNEAAILAARNNRKVIVMEDLLEGVNKVIAGPQKKSRVVTETDKRITAYHESGHAIVAKLLDGCDEVQEVSIIPRGMAAGYTLTRPETDDSHVTRNKLSDTVAMMLGGRAAEEIVIHDVSTGASNDIQRATQIARSMVTEWGMSDAIGNIYLGQDKEVFLGKDFGATHSYSEELGGVIDVEIRKIIDEAYARALEILRGNRNVLDNMVKVLYAKNTIYTDEVNMLFEGKSAEEVIAAIDERNAKKEVYRKDAPAEVNPAINIVPESEDIEPSSDVNSDNTDNAHDDAADASTDNDAAQSEQDTQDKDKNQD
ncbi:MAG: ATP-dependent zinc metalloprotease FtsH [Clostridia bacterium]|nr:ATP-dependent zinc metalloprotease FtsH [Clostridia bacterium]